jgi:hypothetical protein
VDPSFVTPVAANWHQLGFPIALIMTKGISLRAYFLKINIACMQIEEDGGRESVSGKKGVFLFEFWRASELS